MARKAVLLLALALIVGVAWFLNDRANEPPRGLSYQPDESLNRKPELSPGLDGNPPLQDEPAPEDAPADQTPKTAITGRVIDDATESGIIGARLFCANRRLGEHAPYEGRLGLSGEDGAFTINGLGDGTWILVPYHKDYAHPFIGSLFGDDLPNGDDMWKEARALGIAFDVRAGSEHEPFEIRVKKGPRVEGQVIGPGDAPVAGASIRFNFPYYGPLTQLGVSGLFTIRTMPLTVTDAEGRFALSCFHSDMKSVQIGPVREGLLGRWTESLDLARSRDLELRMFVPVALAGSVRWSDGRPEPNAVVVATPDDVWITRDQRIEADVGGRFRFDAVAPGTIELSAFAARPRRESIHIGVGLQPGESRTDVILTLEEQRYVKGVLRTADGKPLEGEWIDARADNVDINLLGADWTDEEGRFAVEVDTDEPVELWLATADREERLASDVRAPKEGLELVATATAAATISVRVVDPEGVPIPSFRLEAGNVVSPQSTDGEGGEASIEVQGSLPYVVHISRPRDSKKKKLPYVPFGMELLSAPTGVIEIQLSTHPEFFGSVLDLEDAPVPGARLFVGKREIPIDVRGRFRFSMKDPTRHKIKDASVTIPAGYRTYLHVGWLSPGEFEDVRVIGGGRVLQGRIVTDDDNAPSLAGITVEAAWTPDHKDDDDISTTAETDAEGNFVFYALPEGKTIIVNGGWDLGERGLYADSPYVRVSPGTSEVVVIDVKSGASISGRIEGPGLSGIDWDTAQVRTILWFGLPDYGPKTDKPSRASPTFRIGGLAPGTYTIALMDADPTLRVRAVLTGVKAGRSDGVLRVPEQDGVIEGTVDMRLLKNDEEMRVAAWRQDASQAETVVEVGNDGRFRLDRLARGSRYTFVLKAVALDLSTSFAAAVSDVDVGDTVHLVPKPSLWIEGRVTGRTPENPVAYLFVHGNWSWTASRIESDGTFRIGPLAPGVFRLVAPGRGAVPVAEIKGVKAGSKNVELVVK